MWRRFKDIHLVVNTNTFLKGQLFAHKFKGQITLSPTLIQILSVYTSISTYNSTTTVSQTSFFPRSLSKLWNFLSMPLLSGTICASIKTHQLGLLFVLAFRADVNVFLFFSHFVPAKFHLVSTPTF